MVDDYRDVCCEYLRPAQINDRRRRANVAFLPLGAIEWHGVQAPVGTDAIKSHRICCLAAGKLGGGVVFPPVVWGVPRDSFYVGTASSFKDETEPVARALGISPQRLRGFGLHGGMDVQEQWLFYQRLLRMSLEQVAGFGFQSIYICTGHNPLIHWAKPVAVTFARATAMAGETVTVACGGEYDAAGLRGDHGGRWETSLMMALAPEAVDLTELDRHPDYRGVGATADASASTSEDGARWAQACASAIADEARWLIDHFPELPQHMSGGR